MKSKINSNSNIEDKKGTKKSLLLTKGREKNLFHFSSLSLDVSIREINLAGFQINSLEGIDIFKNLEVAYLNNNNLDNLQQFSSLKKCGKLKRIQINGNPISAKINIQYGLVVELGRVIQIDDVKVEASIDRIKQWQMQNGGKICLFLLQSCSIFQQMNGKGEKAQVLKSRQNLLAQLKSSRELLKRLNSNRKSSFILEINEAIKENFPLESLPVPGHNSDQIDQIKDYLIEKIIENSTRTDNQFLFKMLSLLEVSSENEEKELLQNTEVTRLILHGMIEKAFQSSVEQEQINRVDIKHLTSADTALQTIDTGARTRKKNSYLKIFHFCMDIEYLRQLKEIIIRELERAIHILEGFTKESDEEVESLEKIFEDSLDQLQFERSQPYRNEVILRQLIENLESIMKKIAFARIKKVKKKSFGQTQVLGVYSSLEKMVKKRMAVFGQMKANYFLEIQIGEKMNKWKVSRIMSAWRGLKKRRLKILKKIVKRKIKNENFLLAISLAKWKMNSRAEKIFSMANAIISAPTQMPKSKKGVDITYRRVIATKNLSLQN